MDVTDRTPTFEELYATYAERTLRLAVFQFGGYGEDIAAEAMARLFRYQHRLDTSRDLWPWLRRVVVNLGRSHYRASSRYVLVDADVLVVLGPTDTETPESLAIAAEDRRRVRCALRSLRERDRRILQWRHYESRGMRDIAAGLGGVRTSAARQQLYRSHGQFRRVYAELLEQAGDHTGTPTCSSCEHVADAG